MKDYEEDNCEEKEYLMNTVNFIKNKMEIEKESLEGRLSNFRTSNKEMWEDAVHFSNDFDKIPEMTHYLSEVNKETKNYENTVKKIKKYERMINSPYFGRFDFVEAGFDEREKVYVGLSNLIDDETSDVVVYDWRAPISSMYYQYELGKAMFNAPAGTISGEMLIKRQYKIENSKLKYFFDSNVTINDEMLQEVLSHNSSAKMKNIVQTIQKEQDIIIRDTENELLIVQGVAGSGKTSIALHRIAFMLYLGLNSKLSSNNIIIISPNTVFNKYISEVLPELGEENVKQTTYDNIVRSFLNSSYKIEERMEQLENLISIEGEKSIKLDSIKFKGSEQFIIILKRLLVLFEKKLIPFEDVYFDGKIIETRQQLKNIFLNNKIGMPIAKRLKRIESMLLDKIHPLKKARLPKIEQIVQNSYGHELEVKSFSRLLSIKESKVFLKQLHKATEVDYMNLYKQLFNKRGLFKRLSEGLELPKNIESIIAETKQSLESGNINYEDSAAILYLKLNLFGSENYSEIKQVVIDEAQDYYPIQYEVFKALFGNARYTVLGDFNQTLEREGDKFLYQGIERILDKKKSVKLFLNKGYRSSYEINSFSQKLLNNVQEYVSFDRHEKEPLIEYMGNEALMDRAIAQAIDGYYKKGYESIAVICKTQSEAEKIKKRICKLTAHKIQSVADDEIEKGTMIIPAYMAKGLEFDVVLVYNVSRDNYISQFDKKLLYIACTRALHQLELYYTGEKSSFIE